MHIIYDDNTAAHRATCGTITKFSPGQLRELPNRDDHFHCEITFIKTMAIGHLLAVLTFLQLVEIILVATEYTFVSCFKISYILCFKVNRKLFGSIFGQKSHLFMYYQVQYDQGLLFTLVDCLCLQQ